VRVKVHFSPPAAGIGSGACAVVIDVLRATSTLMVALAHGATRIIPVATPEEALALRARTPDALLCGEREGLRIAGFDLGNSPDEYGPAVVVGRPLIFASTNGSIALLAAARARRRILAAFVNLQAAADRLTGAVEVAIVAAGKLGRFAIEDAACAGLLCRRLRERGARLDGAAAALAGAIAPGDASEVRALVQGCAHGRYLRSMGPQFARDVELCAGLDTMDQAFEV